MSARNHHIFCEQEKQFIIINHKPIYLTNSRTTSSFPLFFDFFYLATWTGFHNWDNPHVELSISYTDKKTDNTTDIEKNMHDLL